MTAIDPHRHESPTGIVIELFWLGVTAAVVLTAALIVVAGSDVIEASPVRYGVVALLALFAARSWHLHRHRGELEQTEGYRRARERRGF